jgi:hypothetical protein
MPKIHNRREPVRNHRFNKTTIATTDASANLVIREQEHATRMADLAGKPSTSLAQRAWAAECEWRREKALDVNLHRYPLATKPSTTRRHA